MENQASGRFVSRLTRETLAQILAEVRHLGDLSHALLVEPLIELPRAIRGLVPFGYDLFEAVQVQAEQIGEHLLGS